MQLETVLCEIAMLPYAVEGEAGSSSVGSCSAGSAPSKVLPEGGKWDKTRTATAITATA